ncbi:FAD-dependent oxidoreductase [Thalassospira profundimaris]|uniref:FAD-dependent oxidoreductase n=1 Tax=Thalassospira profundimaris TaxID=502049 RepID=A0A367XJW7_9PROT|nr:NAD(P)/FAD-dependent oxidoreductase [Thalassospira profundimaris]RCK53729.1 FAD-dependent oxidoreductase [Thalassospira profundimaris]
MSCDIETIVVGAGVVGLACARALAQSGREVMIIERHDAIGTETSSRNSEVIHAGIYYPKGSLKAELCISGKQALYHYCTDRGITHRNTGKLIVATHDAQIDALRQIEKHAIGNGVTDLTWRSAEEIHDREPAVKCVAALESPSTGIIDSHGLMVSLLGDAELAGATLALNTDVLGGRHENGVHVLQTRDAAGEEMEISCKELVIAGGLHSQTLARNLAGLPGKSVPPQHYARGIYFTLGGKNPFSTLIYPAPEQAGLGIHLTLDLGGQARFGPDVEWIDQPDYTVDETRRSLFAEAIRRYYPDLDETALQPGYAGIRPKIQSKGEAARDFMISDVDTHGVDGLITLYGIESPGLTASMAIGDYVCAKLNSLPVKKAAS